MKNSLYQVYRGRGSSEEMVRPRVEDAADGVKKVEDNEPRGDMKLKCVYFVACINGMERKQ